VVHRSSRDMPIPPEAQPQLQMRKCLESFSPCR
jgi:hypothetical protein